MIGAFTLTVTLTPEVLLTIAATLGMIISVGYLIFAVIDKHYM